MKLITPGHTQKKNKQAVLVIFRSIDGKEWEPVKPEDVPAFIKRPDVVKMLVSGHTAQLESKSPYIYRGEEHSKEETTVH